MDLKGKRLLICEEALTNYKGHFYSWIKAIREIHLNAGAEVLVAGNVNMIQEIRDEFNAFPAYTHNNWSGIYDHKQSWRRYLAVFRHNYRVWKQTKALLKKTGPVDCIIVTSARIHHLIGWKMLCRQALGKDFKRTILFVLTSEAIYTESFDTFYFKRTAALIKNVLRSFKKEVRNGEVIFAGDSHFTTKEYETLSGIPFRVFPSPGAGLQAAQKTMQVQDKNSAGPVRFVILGVSVIEKGIDLLQTAILELLKENQNLNAQFIIQWATPTIDYSGKHLPISDALRNAKQVKLIEHTLDESEYRHYLQQADFIVLPYRRKVYYNRISGVLVEAACAGIPVLVTENTWLSWAMNEFGAGVTIKDEDAHDLAVKISYCINQKSTLKQAAEKAKEKALENNSTEKYLSCVWN
jgi:glycosyltransferase involved in cell wall biosynthesis